MNSGENTDDLSFYEEWSVIIEMITGSLLPGGDHRNYPQEGLVLREQVQDAGVTRYTELGSARVLSRAPASSEPGANTRT